MQTITLNLVGVSDCICPGCAQTNHVEGETAAWRVIAAPKGIPADVQKTLAAALKKVYDSKEYKDFMASRGFGVVWADPQGTAKFMADSDANMGATLKAVGLAK